MDGYSMSTTPEYNIGKSREPCPDRILDDAGGAFAMGAIGGSMVHFIRGIRNSPRGERFRGGFQSMRMNAPRLGGSFAVWGTLFSTMDCTIVYLRQKEDPWNSIIAGGVTGGVLSMRQGVGSVCRGSIITAGIMCLIEGVSIMVNKQPAVDARQPVMLEMEEMSSPSLSLPMWITRFFGGGDRKEEGEVSSESKTEILESFDAPNPPTFEFK